MIDWLVAIILYLYTLALTGIKALRTKLIKDRAVEGDREREYHVFEDIIKYKEEKKMSVIVIKPASTRKVEIECPCCGGVNYILNVPIDKKLKATKITCFRCKAELEYTED